MILLYPASIYGVSSYHLTHLCQVQDRLYCLAFANAYKQSAHEYAHYGHSGSTLVLATVLSAES